MKSKKYILSSDVRYKIQKDLIIKKGIWNLIEIKITEEDFKSKENWNIFINLWKHIDKTFSFETDVLEIIDILDDLALYQIVSKGTDKLNLDLIVSDFTNKNFYDLNAKVVSFDTTFDLLNKNNSYQNVLVFINKYEEEKLLSLNKIFMEKTINAMYAFLDGGFIHLVSLNDYSFGCLECVMARFISRHSTWETSVPQFKIENNEKTDEINYLISLSKLLIKVSQTYGKNILNNKILSIYLPTFELHVDRILKIPFCSTCGYISKKQSQELNINLKTAINKIIENNEMDK